MVGLLDNEERTITTAQNGLEAKENLARDSLDMIRTDHNMPGGDGMELRRTVRRKNIATLVLRTTRHVRLATTLEHI